MNVLSACLSVLHTHAWCPWGPEKNVDPLALELGGAGAGNQTCVF